MPTLIAPDCTRCSLHETRTQVVQPELPPTIKVLFVGRDPGSIEDTEGTPFHITAPAGKMLRNTLRDVGIPPEWCGYMNTVSCHTPANRGPSLVELTACQPWRSRTLRRSNAELAVLLGSEAVEAHYNLGGYVKSRVKAGKGMYPLADWHGKRPGNGNIVVAYHPSAALRSNDMRRLFVSDMKAVASLLGVTPKHPPITVAHTAPPITATLVVDTETVSLTDRTLLGIGIAWRSGIGIVGEWYSGDHIATALNILHAHRGRIAFHNLKFDWDVLAQAGVRLPLRQLDDVMLMAYSLRRDQEVGSLGLKELSLADLGYTWTTLSDMGVAPSDLTDNELGEYCLYDCAATLYLMEKYEQEMAMA